MMKKCNWCDKTTNKRLIDFCDIGWEAFQIGKSKAIISCPEHTNNLRKHIGFKV